MKDSEPLDLTNEVTRRQWLLRLGEVVALAGVSGLVPETLLLHAQSDQQALPPGLYSPSADDLVHALSAHKLLVPPAGSETDYALPSSSPFQPQFFTEQEFRIVTRLVEIILGNVNSDALAQATQWIDLCLYTSDGVRTAAQHLDPQHRALAVAYFGEDSVRDLETADPAAIARKGFAALQNLAIEKYQSEFQGLGAAEQADLVRVISSSETGSTLKKFFTLVRDETIRGYYTSPAGLKELDYKGNSYYAACPGCDSIHDPAGSVTP